MNGAVGGNRRLRRPFVSPKRTMAHPGYVVPKMAKIPGNEWRRQNFLFWPTAVPVGQCLWDSETKDYEPGKNGFFSGLTNQPNGQIFKIYDPKFRNFLGLLSTSGAKYIRITLAPYDHKSTYSMTIITHRERFWSWVVHEPVRWRNGLSKLRFGWWELVWLQLQSSCLA